VLKVKLRKVISGGQTGADKTALVEAKKLGLETGGTAPKGWRTDEGPDYELRDLYSLIESSTSDYGPRTKDNVRNADATVWIGKTGSPGYYCTKNAARTSNKEFYINPSELQLAYIVRTYGIVNFAGNRRRLNPPVVGMVEEAFRIIKRVLEIPDAEKTE